MDPYLKHNVIKSFNNIILVLENNLNILKQIEKEHQELELVC